MPGGSEDLPIRANGKVVACVGCAAALVLGMIAALLFLAIISRNGNMPQPFRAVIEQQACEKNLGELAGALRRYRIKNDRYPDRVSELYPDYLNSDASLWCPRDLSHTGGSSYEYICPLPNADDSTVVLRCRRHQPLKTPIVLQAKLSGQVETVPLDWREAPPKTK